MVRWSSFASEEEAPRQTVSLIAWQRSERALLVEDEDT